MTRASARMSAARPGHACRAAAGRLMSGVWRPASGVRRLAFGVWHPHLASCILHLASCFLLPAHPDAADIGPRPPRRASPQYFGLLSIVSDCRRRSVSRKTVAIYSAIRLSIRATDL
ncbi:phosphotransferase enzyme family protein [Burkholderia pseudomallei 576]|nr:phosphotransferase enzyme family protein [Burkholderia pseudomallei 576]